VTQKLREYRTGLHSVVFVHGVAPQAALAALQTWYGSDGRKQFVDVFEHETALRLAGVNRTDKALIEHGYPKNINEYQDKTARDQYYIANALIALRALDRLLNPCYPNDQPDIFYQNILGLVHKLLLDTLVLLEDWATYKMRVPGIVGIGKNRFEHGLGIYHAALQVIYGNCSPFSFPDNHSDTSINQLRMAIEMRLRRGFGIVAKLNRDDEIVPLALSELIDAIKDYKGDIEFAVPFEHIERLYGWANIYMHSGLKQYTWSPIFALEYLKPFLLKPKGSANFHAGIIAARNAIRQVQSGVENRIDKTQYKLILEEPSHCDVELRT
jgi:hypothetical protein